ncbi:energy transducer TonB [Cetobacterium sp.]|uniref:energy transducer TonB n=2 Tax=Cetobacterium sp. TaxID=2071632 RepID=UPI002FC5A79A
MKFIIFSIALHTIIFISVFTFDNKNTFEIQNPGHNIDAINISMNLSQTSTVQIAPEKPEEESTQSEPEIKPEAEVEVKPEVKTEEPKIATKPKVETKPKPATKPKTTPNKTDTNKNKAETSTFKSNSNDIIELSKGIFAAKNQGVKGLEYKFISQPDPEYPLSAKRIGYNKKVSIKVRFLVGLDGRVEEVKFYNQKDSLGFQAEVEKVLKEWKLTQVTLDKKPIKLYFYKEFKFEQI